MEKEIIEQALKSWKKIGEVVEFIPYGSGHINDTFLVTTKEKQIFCSASIPIPSAMWMV